MVCGLLSYLVYDFNCYTFSLCVFTLLVYFSVLCFEFTLHWVIIWLWVLRLNLVGIRLNVV